MNDLETLLRPRSIAVVGASSDPAKWGNRLVSNTVDLGFPGQLWAINPKGDPHINGSEHRSMIAQAEGDIDLAIAAVPSSAVLEVVKQSVAASVKNLVLPASGFGEIGKEGIDLERQILQTASGAGMRILGPNCFGLFSATGAFNATPFDKIPAGDIALVSQSGNVAGHAFVTARRMGLGFSHVVGLGNQIDLSFADIVHRLAHDDETRCVALYLEGLNDASADELLSALELCRKSGTTVVAIKAGTSEAGRAVALSHTGSLATEDRVWDQILRDAGVIRVRSLDEMFGVLSLARLPRPAARRIAMITDGGGDSIMAVDGLERHNLPLATFADAAQVRIDEVLPTDAPRAPGLNPITLDTAGGVDDDPLIIARCLNVLESLERIDIVVVGGLYGTYEHVRSVENQTADLMADVVARGLPVVVHSPIPVEQSEPLQRLQQANVPVFEDMDRLLRALSLWLPTGIEPEHTVREASGPDGGSPGRQWPHEEAYVRLRSLGVELPPQVVVDGLDEIVVAAAEIGYPICLKTADSSIVHKSDVGGVMMGIGNEEQLRLGARRLTETTGSSRVLVMPSLKPGMEIVMGVRVSALFGPVLVVGRGGIWAEVEADTATLVGEVDEANLLTAMSGLRCAPMLFGGRGQPRLDVSSLVPLARALMEFVRVNPHVSVDLNPIFLHEEGFDAADVRVIEEGHVAEQR